MVLGPDFVAADEVPTTDGELESESVAAFGGDLGQCANCEYPTLFSFYPFSVKKWSPDQIEINRFKKDESPNNDNQTARGLIVYPVL